MSNTRSWLQRKAEEYRTQLLETEFNTADLGNKILFQMNENKPVVHYMLYSAEWLVYGFGQPLQYSGTPTQFIEWYRAYKPDDNTLESWREMNNIKKTLPTKEPVELASVIGYQEKIGPTITIKKKKSYTIK